MSWTHDLVAPEERAGQRDVTQTTKVSAVRSLARENPTREPPRGRVPEPDPADVTPPGITLTLPAGAVLIDTNP